MKDNRVEKEFYSNDKEGKIFYWNNLKKVPWHLDGSWLVLARINDVKRELQQQAKDMSLYYQDVKGNKSFDMNQFQAIEFWQKFVMEDLLPEKRLVYCMNIYLT